MPNAPVEPAGAVILAEGEGWGDQGEVAQATVTPEEKKTVVVFIYF